MSMRKPVSLAARRAFWPSRPIASESCERGGNERFWVIGPRDYVDVLARQLAEDGAVAHAFGPDTRADWIDAALAGRNGDLRAQARLTRDRAHLHRAGFDLWHLGLEQAMHEHPGRARDADLRLARVVLGVEDQHEHRPAGMQVLAGDLFFRGHDAFGTAEVHVNRACL